VTMAKRISSNEMQGRADIRPIQNLSEPMHLFGRLKKRVFPIKGCVLPIHDIEEEKTGVALIQLLRSKGYNVKPLSPEGKDKLTRATAFLVRMEQGGFWLPDASLGLPWLEDLKTEFALWTGHPDETADQIDVCAYACREWQKSAPGEAIPMDGGLMLGPVRGGSAFRWGNPWGSKDD